MSVKEVTILRKSGHLKEAYKMAIDDLKEDRNNSWAQMSLFWVLNDMCKQFIGTNSIDDVRDCLKKMSSLLPTMKDDEGIGKRAYEKLCKQLQPGADAISIASELSKTEPASAYAQIKKYIENPNDVDSSLHEDLGWIIFRYIKANVSELPSLEVRTLLRDYLNLKNERPSMLHSQILNTSLHFSKDHSDFNFYRFFIRWKPENLRDEDWNEWTDKNGNTYKSLALKASKKCFEYLKDLYPRDAELVSWLGSFYDVVIKRAKKDEWVSRQRAIIYVWQQQYGLAIKLYKSLLLEMSEKYYVWSEFADCIQDSNEVKIALLSKALLIERNEDYLGSIHLALADLLIKEGLTSEAICELNIYKKSHESLSKKYQELIERVDISVSSPNNNKSLYNRYVTIAEEYAFSEIEAKEVTLVAKWEKEGKNYCTFTNGSGVVFQVNAKRFPLLTNEKLGSLFSVKCHEEIEEEPIRSDFFSLKRTKITETKYVPLCMHKIEAELWMGLPQKYGYVVYLNQEKKILHIVTQDSELAFHPFEYKWGSIVKGDFVRYRQYALVKKDTTKIVTANVEKVNKNTALPNFSSGVAVVDDVNRHKNLFHYTLGQGKLDGILFFNDTDLRPEVGQCLRIVYCVTKDKSERKKCIVLHAEET